MQWRKLARTKITSGRSRTRNMLCCGRSRKDNGREALDLTASPLRVPSAQQTRNNHPPPMVIQGDFRKVSGISSEIFKQIETVENDHDASTAAALEVSMPRPEEDDWFYILVLHQNRADRGQKNFIPYTAIPDFFHLVIWGHEHDCEITPMQRKNDSDVYISQPGSTVATSLSHGEAQQKKVGILQVYKTKFNMIEKVLQTVRPFIFSDLTLRHPNSEAYDLVDPQAQAKNDAKIKIEEMLADAKAIQEALGSPPMIPFIRLVVAYYTESQTFNCNRMGHEYEDQVANPADMFKMVEKTQQRKKHLHSATEEENQFPDMDDNWASRIEDVIEKYFENNQRETSMSVFSVKMLTSALRRYIDSVDKHAMINAIDLQMRDALEKLILKDPDEKDTDECLAGIKEQNLSNEDQDLPEHVERRGEMIVRILDSRHLGRSAGDAAKRFMAMQDAKHIVQFVEIVKRPGQTLGLYIREGNGVDRSDGVFISRIALESAVYNSGCLKVGDEILAVNLVDVTRMSLDDVVIIMSIPRRLVLATRQRKGGKGGQGSPNVQPRSEHKPPPVVVIKRDLREDEIDEGDMGQHSKESMRQRHTGDGREMSESRSRLGLGLSSMDSRSSGQDSNGLDLYYNSRPPDSNTWGYQPPPPVITEQPKSNLQHFQPYERNYPNTLESLAEKVHSFGLPNRRMSAGGQPLPNRLASQQSPSSHYYVQHSGTGARRIMPRSGSDQHLPHTEYSDYTSITPAGRHSLLRSSLKSGSTLSRYNQRYVDQASVSSQMAQGKYGPPSSSQYGTAGTLTRRNRSSLDYSSDTEATVGPRSSSYYYYRNQAAAPVPHSTIPTLGRNNSLTSTDITTKFNSLPRDTRGGAARLGMTKRFGDRTGSLLQDDPDGALSAPEMPSIRHRDEYRQWLSRTPSTSAIYEQIRASRDVLNQQRAARFTYSAENIHAALKDTDGYYSSYGRPGATSTLDRNFTRTHQPVPSRSLSSQHITGSTSALASTRSPSMRRMRQLLDLDSVRTGAPSPVPTPSGTLPRGQRQLDINPAEFLKYKIDKTGTVGISGLTMGSSGQLATSLEEPISGILWVHLLAGRGLRASTGTSAATTPVTPSGGAPTIGSTALRDLYCVLECDRVHKARTVVRTGDLVFDWDESFELDLVNNRELDLLIYSWDPQYRHKLCYKGSVHLPSLLKSGPLHQLALKIEPRGTLYLRLRHTDSQSSYKRRGLSNLTLSRTTPLFGVDLEVVVNREFKTGGVPGGVTTGLVSGGQQIPIIVRRCVEEVERRGLDIIGLYRLCGSATKKRILREAFERNSRSVDLTPDNVPDINVITGVLKDYLRELPEPLFTRCLYSMMSDARGVILPDDPEGNAKLMFSILDCLPRVNRATLIFLMDHLALVVSASDRNKMSAQNLAIALAPPLMLHSATDSMAATTPGLKSAELDYMQPIAVLKYLLQIWPVPKHHSGRRARPPGPRGDNRSASQVGSQVGQGQGSIVQQQQPSLALREPSRPSAAPFPLPPRSVALGQRGPVPQVPSQQILGPSSVNRGPYRPLSPRVGPPVVSSGLRPRQVIVSSPGSPSSSSDSQSGSDSVKHCLPSRVSSPAVRPPSNTSSGIRSSPSAMGSPGLRHSPSATGSIHNSPSSANVNSPGPRNSPSVTSLSRASPSILTASRSSSPAMQSTSAGLAVTMTTTTPAFTALTGLQSTISNINTTANNIYNISYTQPTTYASTNPFLTGAYLQYTPSDMYQDKYSTISSGGKDSKPFSFSDVFSDQKYATLNAKSSYDSSDLFSADQNRFNTIGSKYPDKSYLTSSSYNADLSKYSPKTTVYETSPNTTQSNSHLGVEDTPTPTSSIETEDSNTREVGEKDVEGDGEQSD